jgi:hypothetical protein
MPVMCNPRSARMFDAEGWLVPLGLHVNSAVEEQNLLGEYQYSKSTFIKSTYTLFFRSKPFEGTSKVQD